MTRKKKISLFIGIAIFIILALASLSMNKISKVASKNSLKNQVIEKPDYQNTQQVLQKKEQIKAKLKEYEDKHIEGLRVLGQKLEDQDLGRSRLLVYKSMEDIDSILVDLEAQNWGNTDDEEFNKAAGELHETAIAAYNYKLRLLKDILILIGEDTPSFSKMLKINSSIDKMVDFQEYFEKKTKIYLEYPDE